MKKLSLGLIAMIALLIGAAAPASAQVRRDSGRVTDNKLSLGASLGYGFRVTDEGDLDDDANPYGLGLGVRGGYTIPGGLYLGGLFQYFGGEEAGNDTVNGHINQMNFAGDIGYDIALGNRFVLRPLVGLGATIVTGEICVLGQCADDQTDPYFLVAPGVNAVVGLGALYLGGEIRYFFLPDDEIPDGFLVGLNIGALL